MVLTLVGAAPGCRWGARKPSVPLSPAPAVQGLSPALYFPVQPGLRWEYQGTGNEFATYTNQVVRAQGDLAQFRMKSGTTTGSLFRVNNDAVTRLARKELAEDRNLLTLTPEENYVLLKAPVVPGTSLANGSETRSIMSIGGVVDVPAGSFQDVVKVEVTTPGQTAKTYEYYARDIGLIRAEFGSGATRVVSDLRLFAKGTVATPPPVVTQVPVGEAKAPPVRELIENPRIIAQSADAMRVSFRVVRTYTPSTPGTPSVQTSDTVVVDLVKVGNVWTVRSVTGAE